MSNPFVFERSVRWNSALFTPPTERLYRLANRLVTHGGDEVVWAGGPVDALASILEARLEFTDEPDACNVAGRASQCHSNAAVNAVERDWRIGTGWALSSDGLWRSHSWNIVDGQICETTMPRVTYAGIALTEMERTLFVLEEIDPFDYATSPEGWVHNIALLDTRLRSSSAPGTDSAWQAFAPE